MVRAYSARLPPEPKSRSASKETELRKQLDAKNKAIKLAARKRKQAEAEALQAQTRRSQIMRAAEKKGQMAAVVGAEHYVQTRRKPAGVPAQSAAEMKAARDAEKMHKDITKILQRTQNEIDEEAKQFQAKLAAKKKAEEKRKREEVRKRVEEEAAAEREHAKAIRLQMKAEIAEKQARQDAFERRKKDLAAKERKLLLAAKDKEEEHVHQALSDWKRHKDATYSKELATRRADVARAEAERKAKLRQAQKEWRAQEEVRLAAEAAMAKRRAEETAHFHERLRERVVQEAIVAAERTAEQERILAARASKDALYAEEAAEREAPKRALENERAAKANNVAGMLDGFRLW